MNMILSDVDETIQVVDEVEGADGRPVIRVGLTPTSSALLDLSADLLY